MVYKLAPYYPAVSGFSDDDAAFLASIGFNAVRVGVIWKAVEPRPGVYSDSYLARIAGTVQTLARHHIVSLLDFHQDMYNERFQGEGAPDWAVQDGGLPNPRFGFPGNYLGNPALDHALDAFFDDAPGPADIGLQSRFADAWRHVAERFRTDTALLGYELLNEPFPGTTWELCASPTGCATFDPKLTALYRRTAAVIREVDRRTLIFYEPNVLFNDGAGTQVQSLGDPGAGFAFHDYCLTEPQTGSPTGCDPFDDLVFSNALAHVRSTREALLESEFGSTTDVAYLRDMLARADRDMVPWLEWAYCGCDDPTATGKQAIVVDPHRPPRGSNVVWGTLRALVEAYPQVIAGTPHMWSFDASTRTFVLRFSTDRAGSRGRFGAWASSEIATPMLVYGGRYGVRVIGGALASAPGAAVLRVVACPGRRTVVVTVTPSGPRRGSCRLPARVRVSAR
jgi:endoglycosylceramidase